MKPVPVCPKCGGEAKLSPTRYGERAACCGLWSWGRKPLADFATHGARQAAHAAFDPLWQSRWIKRGAAYGLLQRELGLTEAACHMAVMDVETARRVPAAAGRIEAALRIERAPPPAYDYLRSPSK